LKIVIFETKFHVTLTLTSDDLESHIVVNVSSTLTNITIWFVAVWCLIVNARLTDGRTFLPGVLAHLSGGDDLKTAKSLEMILLSITLMSSTFKAL